MEKKERALVVKFDGIKKESFDFICGRINGIIDVITTKRIKPNVTVEDKITGKLKHKIINCYASDEEWEQIKSYVFANKLYREIVEVVRE